MGGEAASSPNLSNETPELYLTESSAAKDKCISHPKLLYLVIKYLIGRLFIPMTLSISCVFSFLYPDSYHHERR